jgi:hypothetical protein
MDPELIIKVLRENNPEDYEYREVCDLFNLYQLAFDPDMFFDYIQRMYRDPVFRDSLHTSVIENLLPTFKLLN